MNDKELSLLRKVYSDIITGYSRTIYQGSSVLIKHFTSFDQGLIDCDYESYYENAINQGLPNSKDRLKILIDSGLWSEDNEVWIADQKYYINNLNKTKAELPWQSQIDKMSADIKIEEDKLKQKQLERDNILGLTAETYASKKLNESYIYNAFRRADSLDSYYFEKDSFDNFAPGELDELVGIYNKTLMNFNLDNLKKISLAGFFQSVFGLCDDNPFTFFGKAVCNLTYYQSEIFSYGRLFKHIIGQDLKPDEKLLDEPDRLIEWWQSSKKANSLLDGMKNADNTNSTSMVFGASRRDIEAAGYKVAPSPVKKLQEAGGSLDMDATMRLSGN